MSDRQGREEKGPVERISLCATATAIDGPHMHRRLGEVNDHEVLLTVNEIPFPWHDHPDSDELFFVLEGLPTLEFGDGAVVRVAPGSLAIIPVGTPHMSQPESRTVNLVVRRAEAQTRFHTL